MGAKLFGTDGVRGKANIYPMTAEFALRLGNGSRTACLQQGTPSCHWAGYAPFRRDAGSGDDCRIYVGRY